MDMEIFHLQRFVIFCVFERFIFLMLTIHRYVCTLKLRVLLHSSQVRIMKIYFVFQTISDSEQAIASYKRSNQQLANQVGEQRKQILQLQEKLKETSASAQKVLDQRALKEQLEVHIQTIGILVSEKSELQSNLATVQKKLSNKDNEITELNHVLKTTQNRLVDFEKTVHEMKNMEGNLQKVCILGYGQQAIIMQKIKMNNLYIVFMKYVLYDTAILIC